MSYNFTELMSKKSDEELIAILTVRKGEYADAAINAAQTEFEKRHLPEDKIEKIRNEQIEIKDKEVVRANEPLESDIKVLSIFLPLVARLMYYEKFRTGGYDRKLEEMSRVFWISRLIFLALIILIIILVRMM